MASSGQAVKPKKSIEEIEDGVLRIVFLITLTPPATPSSTGSLFLESLVKELQEEGVASPRLSRAILERVLFYRLSMSPAESPALSASRLPDYLLGCYRRASEETRKASERMKDPGALKEILETLKFSKELCVSYFGLMLQHPDMFPKDGANAQVVLLEAMLADFPDTVTRMSLASSGSLQTRQEGLPRDFFDQFVARFENEGLEEVLQGVFFHLPLRLQKVSPLGHFLGVLSVLKMLVSYPAVARALVKSERWCPSVPDGRRMEITSFLGPFLHVSIIPDPIDFFANGIPSVREQCFSNPTERRPADLQSSFTLLQTSMRQLCEGLHDALLTLLKQQETREGVLQFLAKYVELNAKRSQIQMDPRKLASHGGFFNLGAVMLRLCEPFLDQAFSKIDKLDPSYILHESRLNFSDLTAIHASSEEVASWVDKRNHARIQGFRQVQAQREEEERRRAQGGASASSSSPSSSLPSPSARNSSDGGSGSPALQQQQQYHFICECFFITARVLHLGVFKVLSEHKEIVTRISRIEREALPHLEALQGTHPRAAEQLKEQKRILEEYRETRLCYEAQLADVQLIQLAMRFYSLMVKWLTGLLGGMHLPLPTPCPLEFASMPEHFVEDVLETLLWASSRPRGLESTQLDTFMCFCVMLMGSPVHVKNPYLRSKMVTVLTMWLPSRYPHGAMAADMASLFEGHEMAQQHLVPSLLRLYVDIEFTGGHAQFYDKFGIRTQIGDLLEYLWRVPGHHRVWVKVAEEEERGFYLRFTNLLVNDSIFLLDDGLKNLTEIREHELAMADTEQWQQLTEEDRTERERAQRGREGHTRWSIKMASEYVKLMEYTTEEIRRPFLLPEMVDRIAAMLNYFLLQLVGPSRKQLRVKDMESKYEFHPKQLLTQIVKIYANLAAGDTEGEFASAISRDARSYREELFRESHDLLRASLDPTSLNSFATLITRVREAAAEEMQTEEVLGEVPDDFLDPIQYTLMKDPVILPSSKMTVDRATITRHLLSDQNDPFNRSLLTVDMLVPNVELKEKIDAFIANQKKQ